MIPPDLFILTTCHVGGWPPAPTAGRVDVDVASSGHQTWRDIENQNVR